MQRDTALLLDMLATARRALSKVADVERRSMPTRSCNWRSCI
jgi:hypothetical protein